MEEILSRARKVAEAAEVFWVCSDETPVRFEANRLKQLEAKQSTLVVLRIIKEGKIGLSTATGLSDSQALVDMAVEAAQFGALARFEMPAAYSYPQVEAFDPEVGLVTSEEMIGLGEGLIARVRGHTPDILCEVGITKGTISVRILNSRGGEVGYSKSVFGLAIEGSLIRDTDMLFVGDFESSCHPVDEFHTVAEEVITQLEWAKNQAVVPTKHLPVVFTPKGVVSALIAPLVLAFNGRTVLEGASPLANRMGENVFDSRLSLWDDATIPYRPASRPCDDEGVPSQRTTLIDRGAVANFIYDLQTAALADTRSTGNGSRAEGGVPAPSMSALIIGEGDTTFKDMVGDMKEGLVIEQLMGAEQGNVLGGKFSGNVLLGYKVERGEIVGRVKDTMVSGNVYEVLRELVSIGHEAEWVGGMVRAPHLYCQGLSVVAKE